MNEILIPSVSKKYMVIATALAGASHQAHLLNKVKGNKTADDKCQKALYLLQLIKHLFKIRRLLKEILVKYPVEFLQEQLTYIEVHLRDYIDQKSILEHEIKSMLNSPQHEEEWFAQPENSSIPDPDQMYDENFKLLNPLEEMARKHLVTNFDHNIKPRVTFK